MPFALYLLGLAVFAQGTSEFMLSGLLPDIAQDLGVSIPLAGSLTSAFAVGMIVGAPLTALLASRWSRRTALTVLLGTFLLVHVLGALTPDFGVLLAGRVVAALANAGFLAVALVAATDMVGPEARGRATAVLLGGTTLACVVGVPGGALLGHLWGWRTAFWAVALLSVPALVAIARAVPNTGPGPAVRGARPELRLLRRPRPLVTLLVCALANGAMFCGFTYLAPVVTDVTGLASGWVPALLALFGAGSFAGVVLAGRLADARPLALVAGCGTGAAAGWSLFALTAGNAAATVALVVLLGALSFALGSTLITRALRAAAAEAPTLAGAFVVSALNIGAAVGPWLGAAVIGAGHGYRAPLWTSALLTALALATAAAATVAGARAARRRTATEEPPAVRTPT
ncbi:MFS transporter [Streptomyces sp. Je 1-79]|uniref:Cmx/CmrA family chloramphenicol efflux MFS transporter n=1 Tax=Streptomyces sp. Je 1-79 TaxID=2943847 RepID=UPI0021A5050B|nr:Cmx/CmrA family chloramphenicol efflux MFS transporter [Streptomyces sp. Je 1-79]MCT4351989.1 MFS transporter [Streptomyces sp. Je 1-79]